VEIAWAAIKKKNSYYREEYYRLRSRLGPRKAIIAIGHRILKAIYHIIERGEPYRELGQDYLNKKSKHKNLSNLPKQARRLGFALVPVEV